MAPALGLDAAEPAGLLFGDVQDAYRIKGQPIRRGQISCIDISVIARLILAVALLCHNSKPVSTKPKRANHL
jgi:hypothetical protein